MTQSAETPPPDYETAPLALVTGASSGIGRELARVFAENGFDLVIAAEDAGIEAAETELRAHGGSVRAVRVDLRSPAGVDELYATCRAAGTLDAAALNAGVGQGGRFLDIDISDEQSLIDLNVSSTVRLAKHVLRDMVARGEGRVLITSSIASTMPGTYQAVYNASKSFLQSFSEAIQAELRDEKSDVTVTALMPGPTETEFFHRADMDDTNVGSSSKDDPAQVAEQGYKALLDGDDKVFGGSVTSRAQGKLAGVLPDRLKAAMHRRMAAPGSAQK
jgi:short-subunit dehydrogenase